MQASKAHRRLFVLWALSCLSVCALAIAVEKMLEGLAPVQSPIFAAVLGMMLIGAIRLGDGLVRRWCMRKGGPGAAQVDIALQQAPADLAHAASRWLNLRQASSQAHLLDQASPPALAENTRPRL